MRGVWVDLGYVRRWMGPGVEMTVGRCIPEVILTLTDRVSEMMAGWSLA